MSNLAEKSSTPRNLSHNQCLYSGPCINQKLTTALIHLRFDDKLLVFDIKKAFLQILLQENDQNKLLFMWYRNVQKQDYSIVAYKNVRLPFGLPPSPTTLMVALYKILVIDAVNDPKNLRELKNLIYAF